MMIPILLTGSLIAAVAFATVLFRRWTALTRAHVDTVRTLVSAIDAADPFTRGHAERITRMSLLVGTRLGMSEKALAELEYAALLHDIGRAAIYYDVLLKPGRLDENEKALMQTHPKVGYDIIRNLKFMEGAAEIVYAHHEQPNGAGYPRGLKGDAVPLGARIIGAAAAYDAMTQDRPYRRGLTAEHAIEELEAKSGVQFCPEVVQVFVHLYESGQLDFEETAGRTDEEHRLSA